MPRKSPTQAASQIPWRPARSLLTAREGAQAVGLSVPAFWKGVKDERLPKPVYPMPRAPRWFEDELLAALEGTRAAPSEAMAKRRLMHFPGCSGVDPY
jgi:predicted DNA-binding transcriptional regulator AlpA